MRADARLVPLAGIEPALLAELDFESSASTSSATGAFGGLPWGPASRSGRNIAGAGRGSTRAEVIVPCLDRFMPKGYDAFTGRRLTVTLATARPSHAGKSADPGLTAALAVAIIAAATLAGAWFFQLVLDIRPCPLCLEQRYAYYLAVPLGALIAVAAARDAPRAVLYAGLGAYHAGVEWGFWKGPTDCTGPVGFWT